MKVISRSPTKRNEGFYRYLKPGALAKLRDSKISARSQKTNSLTQLFLPHRVNSPLTQIPTQAQAQISMFDQVPCLLSKIYGPRCIRRKKLVAAKSVLLNISPVLESSISSSGSFLLMG